jgi:hypothetical protein
MPHPQQTPTTVAELWKSASELDSWPDIVLHALRFLGGEASLDDIYRVVAPHPRAKIRKFWKDKVRQKLEAYDAFVRISRGRWGFAEGRSKNEIAKLNAIRAELHPLRPRTKPVDSEA